MKKKNKELTKVSMFFHSKGMFGLFLFCLILCVASCIWDKSDPSQLRWSRYPSAKYYTPFIFVCVLGSLRRRVIDSKGVSSTYLGIKYKHISWQNLHHYTIEKFWHKLEDKTKKPSKARIMLVFKAIPVKGESTTIMVEATKEARALAEKYFGPPQFVQEGISFEEGK